MYLPTVLLAAAPTWALQRHASWNFMPDCTMQSWLSLPYPTVSSRVPSIIIVSRTVRQLTMRLATLNPEDYAVSSTSTLDSSSTDFVIFCSNNKPAGPAHDRPPFPDDDSGGSGPGSGGGSGGSALKEAGSKGNVQRSSGQYNQ